MIMCFFIQLNSANKKVAQVGYGFSKNLNLKKAVSKAVKGMKKKVKKPDIIFLFSTATYDPGKLLKEVKKRVGKNVKIYGGTSCEGVLTPKGYLSGKKKNSLALLGIASKKMRFGVGGASIKVKGSAEKAGETAALAAVKNAGKRKKDKPAIVFITATPDQEEEVLEGIKRVIGKNVPMFGGSAADNDITGKWAQFVNNKVYNDGVSIALLYTDLKVGYEFEAGYLRTQFQAKITKADKRIIYEIDNKPAAEVYNKWLNGKLNAIMKKGGSILAETTCYPLAKVVKGKKGETYYLTMHPISINMPEKSLKVFANVKSGDEISVLYGGWELLLNRAFNVPLRARTRGNIDKNKGVFAIYTFCAGSMMAIPEDERHTMSLLIKNAIGDVPFLGTFTFGEQGFFPGLGNVHGNLVSSLVIIGE